MAYDLDLDILPLDLHTKNQVRVSVRSAVRVVTHTDTGTVRHTYTDDVKTITPIADAGHNKLSVSIHQESMYQRYRTGLL